MSWPIDISSGPFANTTLVGVAMEFIPHIIFHRLADGSLKAYGTDASLICNATWAMGIKLHVRETSDKAYGNMSPDGQYRGALRDLAEQTADITLAPMARIHPYDDFFVKSVGRESIRIVMVAGMRQVYQKSSTSVIDQELLTEVFPVLVAVAIMSIVLSSIFNVIINGGSPKPYADLFFMFYYPTLLNETSHAQVLSNNRITFSSKILFGSWLLAIFVITVFIQSSLKSSFVVLVETERIRDNKDVLDHPTMLPIMHSELPLYLAVRIFLIFQVEGLQFILEHFLVLTAMKMQHGEEILAQWERLRPASDVPLADYYSAETVEKVVSRRAVIYADEFGSIYELPRLCPKIKGAYIYQSSGVTEVQNTFYYRPGINSTLARELNKRCRWLMEANIPWLPRHIMDPTNSPCFVKSHTRDTFGGTEATHLSAEDLFGVWIVLCAGSLFSSVIFLGELVFSDNFFRMVRSPFT